MPLGERHRPRIKPSVDYFRNAGHSSLAFSTTQFDIVNHRLMQVERLGDRDSFIAQLLNRANSGNMPALFAVADPEGKRSSPEPFAGERPIDIVFEPVKHSAGANFIRVPFCNIQILYQLLLELGGLNIPALAGGI